MPRIARLLSDNGLYHIMMRGNNRQKIFIDQADKDQIVKILYAKASIDNAQLYAYAIMDTHFHFVFREDSKPLSLTLKRIGIAYAQYFNKKYKKVGHVFQDRFKSEVIESDRQLLAVIRYVHLNPVKAGIGSLESYTWSSYHKYTSCNPAIEDSIKMVLSLFSDDLAKASDAFIRFHSENNSDEFIDIPEEKIFSHEKIEEFVCKLLDANCITRESLKHRDNRYIRDRLVLELTKQTELSLRDIAKLLDMNRETIRQASLSSEPSQ